MASETGLHEVTTEEITVHSLGLKKNHADRQLRFLVSSENSLVVKTKAVLNGNA